MGLSEQFLAKSTIRHKRPVRCTFPIVAIFGRTDGTPAGSYLLKEDAGYLVGTATIGEQTALFTQADVFDLSNDRLWVTDGTPADIRSVAEFAGEPSRHEHIPVTAVGDNFVFQRVTEDGVGRTWVSDGSRQGTRPLNVYRHAIQVVEEQLYFIEDDSLRQASGLESESQATSGCCEGLRVAALVRSGELLFHRLETATQDWIAVYDVSTGTWQRLGAFERTQGSSLPRTQAVHHLTVHNERAYFTYKYSLGTELWSSDGSLESTKVVELLPGVVNLYEVHDEIWANKNFEGDALWGV